jgi:hypothetical protein
VPSSVTLIRQPTVSYALRAGRVFGEQADPPFGMSLTCVKLVPMVSLWQTRERYLQSVDPFSVNSAGILRRARSRTCVSFCSARV